jgi:hypothetical protein
MTFIWELDICNYVEKSKGDFYSSHPIAERETNKEASNVISGFDFDLVLCILKSKKVVHSFWSNCGKGTPEISSLEDILAAREFQNKAAKKKDRFLRKITVETTHAGCITCREELVDILICEHRFLGKRCVICYPGNKCSKHGNFMSDCPICKLERFKKHGS